MLAIDRALFKAVSCHLTMIATEENDLCTSIRGKCWSQRGFRSPFTTAVKASPEAMPARGHIPGYIELAQKRLVLALQRTQKD